MSTAPPPSGVPAAIRWIRGLVSLLRRLFGGKSQPPAPAPAPDVAALARESSYVFSGTIQALGASNLDGVSAEPRLATINVEEVAIAPPELGDLRGQTITVHLVTTAGLAQGQRVTFFARSWHYGRTLGVEEVGRATTLPPDIGETVVASRLQLLDQRVEERLRGADVVLSGRVVATRRAERSDGLPGRLEGVEWWTADLWIASVEKGTPPEDRRMWFPEGGDRDWGPVPKAFPGQSGIWLLRRVEEVERDEEGGRADDGERRLMAIDPLDYHAAADLPRIQALLWRLSPPEV